MQETSSPALPTTNQAHVEASSVTNQSRPIRAKSVWVNVMLPLSLAVLLGAAQPFWSSYLSDLVVVLALLMVLR